MEINERFTKPLADVKSKFVDGGKLKVDYNAEILCWDAVAFSGSLFASCYCVVL